MVDVTDLSRLEPPAIIEPLDFEAIRSELIADLQARDDGYATIVESDPAVKVLEVAAYRLMSERARINDAARQLLTAFATGSDLDHIGVTYYGTDRLPDESDADYLRRLRLAYDRYSTAGSAGGYIYHALSADPNIRDARAIVRAAGEVLIPILVSYGDGTPSGETLTAVEDALGAEDVRPLNDTVVVSAADIIQFEVNAVLTLRPGPSPDVVVQSAVAAVQGYVDTHHALGADIVRGALEAALYVEGVERATLTSPSDDIPRDAAQAAYCTGITVDING